jgi:hypothetical protein
MTSGSEDTVALQGPDEQYATWPEVEAHYGEQPAETKTESKEPAPEKKEDTEKSAKRVSSSGNALSQALLDKLNFAKQPAPASPGSTPPMSPSSSEPQSSKTSPEVKIATIASVEKSPVPPMLKPLLNPVVWYVHEKQAGQKDVYFLTNSADTQHLARDFKIPTKTIHQLRNAIGMQETTGHQVQKKQSSTTSLNGEPENKTLFSYEDESEEEEVVFKPRGRGTPRPVSAGRGGPHGSIRAKGNHPRSPRLSFTTPAPPPVANKPQIPVEEIDPDSFDRGSFGRGSVPLANTGNLGNHVPNHFTGTPRGPGRGGFPAYGQARGTPFHRGGGRGFDRGAARGRGRLFVP